MPFDVAAVRPDFLVTVGYKWLLGPFGLGYLYVAEEHWEGEPLEQNWIVRAGAEEFADLVDYRDEYQPGARRFDVGQRTKFELVPMAVAALGQLGSWGVSAVADALSGLTQEIMRRAAAVGLKPLPAAQRGPHLLGVRLSDPVRARIVPELEAAGVYAAVRGRSLRISPHLHVDDHDVERLTAALAGATDGARG
jgi:selenocysteine lyase/cysteine desulfurase